MRTGFCSVLGTPGLPCRLGRTALNALNGRGIFANLDDTEPALDDLFYDAFGRVDLARVGAVTIFTARQAHHHKLDG